MSVYALSFSPTGGTAKAAEILAFALSPDAKLVDILPKTWPGMEFSADDLCVIAVPSYGGRVPAAALRRIALMKAGGARAVITVSFGNRAIDDTLLELQDAAVAAGFKVIAGIEAVTEHSLAPVYGTGRPDMVDTKELQGFAERILALSDDAAAPLMPGNRPFRSFGGVPVKPKAGKACTACGLCAEGCPTGAIDKANPKATDADKCITCMHCVSVCPNKARAVNALALAGIEAGLKKGCSGRKENRLYI